MGYCFVLIKPPCAHVADRKGALGSLPLRAPPLRPHSSLLSTPSSSTVSGGVGLQHRNLRGELFSCKQRSVRSLPQGTHAFPGAAQPSATAHVAGTGIFFSRSSEGQRSAVKVSAGPSLPPPASAGSAVLGFLGLQREASLQPLPLSSPAFSPARLCVCV